MGSKLLIDYKKLAKRLQNKFHTKFISHPEYDAIEAPYVYGNWELDKEITNYLKQLGYKIMFNGIDDASMYNFE